MPKRIAEKEAKQAHGISTLHETMENGERRFRLKHVGGSAYVRTEAGSASGWQASHYHRHVRETYVMERGWMGFAELRNGEMVLRLLESGEIVTTEPGIVHNVYLPPNAVIHTVKHGEGAGEDRQTDGDAPAFDLVTRSIVGGVAVRAAAVRPNSRAAYSEEYRHFDTLIWQVPAWSTAIFAISGSLIADAAKGVRGDPSQQGAAGLMCFVSLCLLVFAMVLSRFRTHQRSLKGYSSTPIWKSAQSWTQALIAVQYSILLGVGLNLLGLARPLSILTGLAMGAISFSLFEIAVRHDANKHR